MRVSSVIFAANAGSAWGVRVVKGKKCSGHFAPETVCTTCYNLAGQKKKVLEILNRDRILKNNFQVVDILRSLKKDINEEI